MGEPSSLEELTRLVRDFALARHWDEFHLPKNLAMALAGEAGELLALFQWLTPEQAKHVMSDSGQEVRDELADVLHYTLRLADVLDVDLADALRAKLATNAQRYPVELARGNATKYDRLQEHGDAAPRR
jgi:dCTP diphosphatase